jgi:hypothetical protein
MKHLLFARARKKVWAKNKKDTLVCVLIPPYTCPHATIYVSSSDYSMRTRIYICVLQALLRTHIRALMPLYMALQALLLYYPIYMSAYHYICVLKPLYMCDQTTMYVSSYHYVCVLILLYMCPHICVLIPPYMCPHAIVNVPSYLYIRVPSYHYIRVIIRLCICLLILLHKCPHMWLYICHMITRVVHTCHHTTLHMSPHFTTQVSSYMTIYMSW